MSCCLLRVRPIYTDECLLPHMWHVVVPDGWQVSSSNVGCFKPGEGKAYEYVPGLGN